MIYYLQEQNPDDRDVAMSLKKIENDFLVITSIESGWVILFNANSKAAIHKVEYIKKTKEIDSKNYLMVNSLESISKYVDLENAQFKYLKKIGPSSIIFEFEKHYARVQKCYLFKKSKSLLLKWHKSILIDKIIDKLQGQLAACSLNNQDFKNIPYQYYSYQVEANFEKLIDCILDVGLYEFLQTDSLLKFKTERI